MKNEEMPMCLRREHADFATSEKGSPGTRQFEAVSGAIASKIYVLELSEATPEGVLFISTC